MHTPKTEALGDCYATAQKLYQKGRITKSELEEAARLAFVDEKKVATKVVDRVMSAAAASSRV